MKSITENIQGVSYSEAQNILISVFPECRIYELDYYAWPCVFSNTAGPFSYPGVIAGAAMTTFTIEAWVNVDGNAVVFCKGKVLKVIDKFEGSNTRV